MINPGKRVDKIKKKEWNGNVSIQQHSFFDTQVNFENM